MIKRIQENSAKRLVIFDNLLSKNDTENCCTNKPIYEITYSLGTKWLVCNECLELEQFQYGIQEKVRMQK